MLGSLSTSPQPADETPALLAIPLGRISILCGLAILAIVGCSKSNPKTTAAIAPPKPDPWILSCNDPNAEEPAYLPRYPYALRVNRDLMFPGPNKAAGFKKTNFEFPLWTKNLRNVRISYKGKPLDPKTGTNYTQTLDMRTGILMTKWVQDGLRISAELSFMEDGRSVGNINQTWSFQGAQEDLSFVIEKAEGAQSREGFDARDEYRPYTNLVHTGDFSGKEDLRGAIGIDKNGCAKAAFSWFPIGQMMLSSLPPHRPEKDVKYYEDQWKTDIIIDGPVEDQQAVRSFMFYLRSAMPKHYGQGLDQVDDQSSISPFGLSDPTYNGHVFWDADIWLFPAMAMVDPDCARAIADYRLRTFALRQKKASKPTDPPFPWESALNGEEGAPEAMRNEIHINGDVAWMLDNAAALGLIKQQEADKVIKKVADYYLARANDMPDGKYELKDVVSPDEFHTGDNDLYTNLLAQWTQKKANRNIQFYLPRDKETYLTYDSDPIRGYKQAAAVLGIYPLQMINDAEARKMMDRYADKVTKNGPAMSHSVYALIWARLGESEKAYDEWRKSWQLYTNHPLMLFSEKPKKKTTYFTTGAAGCLQTVLYGFLGFRIDYEKDKMAAWSTPLNNGKWISIHPRLPAKWKSVKFTNFTVKGKRYNLTIDASGVKVNQGEP